MKHIYANLLEVLRKEREWHEAHFGSTISPEYEKGFIAGMKHADSLVVLMKNGHKE